MKKIHYLFGTLSLLGFMQTAAAYNDEVGCSFMHVQIANDTSSSCQLVNQRVFHGNLETSPPRAILNGNAGRFDMAETIYGPEIDLTYRCDNKEIALKTHQNYCFILRGGAGGVSTKVISHDHGIHAYADAQAGSWFWNRPGQVTWTITSDDDV